MRASLSRSLRAPPCRARVGPGARLRANSVPRLAPMADTALHDLTLAEASALIKARRLSPVEYTQALLARTDALEPQLDAYITRTSEAAIDGARAAEAEIALGHWRGPLHGIPFALKDIYDTSGVLTSGHSRICIDRVPTKDATTVAKLKAAGAVLMG